MVNRVCFVTGALRKGGAERVISTLSNIFSQRGIDVTIFCIGKLAPKIEYPLSPGIRVIDIQAGEKGFILRKLRQLYRLRKEVKALAPDVVISFMEYVNIQMLAALIGVKIPKVFSIRCVPRLTGRIATIVNKALYPLAAGGVFQTPEQQSFFPAKKRRDTIIWNPVFGEALQAEYKPAQEDGIITAGRLTAQKNHSMLVRAFASVAEAHPSSHLTVLGEGEDRSSLTALAEELGISDRVSLPGVVDDVISRISKAKLFVFSSHFEGMPNALIEAMCIGMPCISTRFAGGAADMLIQDGVNGLLAPCDDPGALAAAIKRLLDDEDLRKKLGENAKKIRDKVDPEKIADIWLAYLESLST